MTDQDIYSSIRTGGRKLDHATQHILQSNVGMLHDIKSKLHIPDAQIKDMYADAISHLVWNIRTGKFKSESKVSTYLYRIFYNKSVDHLRHISTNKNKPTTDISELTLDSGQQMEKDTYTNIAFEQVKSEIYALGEPCRGIILDWAYWGYSMKEIAERNNLENADSAKKRKYGCLQKLRRTLTAKHIQ